MSVFANFINYFKGDDDDEIFVGEERSGDPEHTASVKPDERRRHEIGRTINVNATAQLLVILEKPNNFHDVRSIAD
ncbi:MAG: hypothetical protein LBM41_02445, partial [Ruminococcus sp.]|nr:hypothetical protein [Ruminococcus sp.]